MGQFNDVQTLISHIQNAKVGDDPVYYALARQWQGAGTQHLGVAVFAGVVHHHHHHHAPATRSIAPRIAMAILPPRIMAKEVALSK
jgi:hypothetical protein